MCKQILAPALALDSLFTAKVTRSSSSKKKLIKICA